MECFNNSMSGSDGTLRLISTKMYGTVSTSQSVAALYNIDRPAALVRGVAPSGTVQPPTDV